LKSPRPPGQRPNLRKVTIFLMSALRTTSIVSPRRLRQQARRDGWLTYNIAILHVIPDSGRSPLIPPLKFCWIGGLRPPIPRVSVRTYVSIIFILSLHGCIFHGIPKGQVPWAGAGAAPRRLSLLRGVGQRPAVSPFCGVRGSAPRVSPRFPSLLQMSHHCSPPSLPAFLFFASFLLYFFCKFVMIVCTYMHRKGESYVKQNTASRTSDAAVAAFPVAEPQRRMAV